ncbi:MAG TPA: outer membrane beta-barrel protein [Methylibium sp.]
MKKTVYSLAFAAAALVAAPAAQAQYAPAPVRLVIGGGITGGGDRLATVYYNTGNSYDITAGSLIHVFVGGEWRVAPRVSMQANVGYHFDRTDASNGSIRFERFPIELLAHYDINPVFRLGGGVRFVTGAKLAGTGAVGGDIDFQSTTGLVLEGEYMMSSNLGLKLRAVPVEDYTPSGGGSKLNGSHVGFYLTGYF